MNTWHGLPTVCTLSSTPGLLSVCFCAFLTWVLPPLWSRYRPHPEPWRPSWRFQLSWPSIPPSRRTFWGRMSLLQTARQNQSIDANIYLNVYQKSISIFHNCGFKLVAQTVCNILVWKKKSLHLCAFTDLSVSKTNFWNLCLSVSAENTTCTGRLLRTCKGIKSFLDLLSFQQICHRHFVSWREGKRGRGQRIEKGAKLEMKEYYFKQFSADNSQSGTTNSGGFDTKANSQIWSVTSGSDLRTWWLLRDT